MRLSINFAFFYEFRVHFWTALTAWHFWTALTAWHLCCLFVIVLSTPWYSWYIAKCGVKHQSINQSLYCLRYYSRSKQTLVVDPAVTLKHSPIDLYVTFCNIVRLYTMRCIKGYFSRWCVIVVVIRNLTSVIQKIDIIWVGKTCWVAVCVYNVLFYSILGS
jgi:hypothetical protein